LTVTLAGEIPSVKSVIVICTVSGAESTCPSLTISVIVLIPLGKVTAGLAPVTVPPPSGKGPLHRVGEWVAVRIKGSRAVKLDGGPCSSSCGQDLIRPRVGYGRIVCYHGQVHFVRL